MESVLLYSVVLQLWRLCADSDEIPEGGTSTVYSLPLWEIPMQYLGARFCQ
jgi:hypothetical protein